MPYTVQRRGFITSLLAAPFIIRTPGLLMPVKPTCTALAIAIAQMADVIRQNNEDFACIMAQYQTDRHFVRLPTPTWQTLYHADGTPLMAADA